jgi:hypothetical protein
MLDAAGGPAKALMWPDGLKGATTNRRRNLRADA